MPPEDELLSDEELAAATAGPRVPEAPLHPPIRMRPGGTVDGAEEEPAALGPPIRARPGGPEAEPGEEVEETGGRRRRRKRDPFKDLPRTYSREAATTPRQLTTLSAMKQIKRARVRHEGRRVITDDVRKLKSLTIEPRLAAGEFVNFYVEPVRVEYYIPKESRFAVETKYLYVPLVDPEPREQDDILRQNMANERFVDLIDVMNEYPMHITSILDAYNISMRMFESLSRSMYEADGNEELYRTAFYLCEVLIEYEPTLAALEFLGDFMSWNLNWLVRRMNVLGLEFSASDKTVSYFIKKRNQLWEEKDYDYDERFEILAALFFEQAFPNRGLSMAEDDYIFGAF